MDLLEVTDTVTHCPYKGDAGYWNLRLGDKTYKDYKRARCNDSRS